MIKIKGFFTIVVRDAKGKVKYRQRGTNLITSVGKAAIVGLIGNTGGITAFSYLAVGTSSTAATAADTTLGAEVTDTGLGRASATVSRTTTSVTNDTLQLQYTWTATGAKSLNECGIFNAASSGTLLGHKIFTSTITTANTDTVTVTYSIQLT